MSSLGAAPGAADAGALDGEMTTTTRTLVADQALLRYLQAQRDAIATAEAQLEVRIQHNEGADLLLSAAQHELDIEAAVLKHADALEDTDGGRAYANADALSEHNAIESLLRLSELASREPLLRGKAFPRAEIEQLVSGPTWTAGDTDKLRQITLVECKSILAHRLLRTHGADEVIELVEKMSEEELSKASLPYAAAAPAGGRAGPDPRNHGSREGEGVDWNTVSQIVGRHAPDDCRTHWHMHARPGIDSASWSTEERTQLVELVDKYKMKGDPVVPWEQVAEQVGGGRTGYACLTAYRRLVATADSSTWTEDDTDAMLENVAIYGPQWSQVASRLPHPHTAAAVSKQFAKLQKNAQPK